MATEPKPKLVRGVVAPGRTVYVGSFGNPAKGEPRTLKECGPGTELEFPPEEAEHLLKAGFLLHPDGSSPVPAGAGPVYDRDSTIVNNPAGIGPRSAGFDFQGPRY